MEKKIAFPISFSVALILAWWLHPLPFEPSDLWGYSVRAYSFVSPEVDKITDGHIFSQRLSTYVPVGVFYSIVGVSMEATTLWPLTAMVGIVWGLWYSGISLEEKIISCLLAITSLPFFFQFTTLRPDIFVSFSCLIFFIILSKRGKTGNIFASTLLVAGVLYFGAFAKLSIYWAGAVWLVIAAEDVYVGRWSETKRIHTSVIIGGLIALIAYLVTCQAVWGNPLARLEGLESVSGSHLWSWNEKTFAEKVKRLTYGPLWTFVTAYGPLFPFTVGGLLMWRKGVRFWDKALLTILLLYWFGTTSPSMYEPLPAVSRMILPAFPLMCITAGSFIWNDLLSRETATSQQLISFAVVSVLLVLNLLTNLGSKVQLLSSGLALTAIGVRFLPSLPAPKWIKIAKLNNLNALISTIALAGAVAVTPSARFLVDHLGRPDAEKGAMTLVTGRLLNQQVILLTGDQRSPNHLNFYYDYSYPSSLTVRYAESRENIVSMCDSRDKNTEVLFMYNRGMSEFLQKAYGREFVSADQIEKMYERKLFDQGKISIFRICGGS